MRIFKSLFIQFCEYNLVNRIKGRVFCTLNIFFYGFLSDNGLTDNDDEKKHYLQYISLVTTEGLHKPTHRHHQTLD